ncbi:hypothetical protein JHK86_000800 [Glycine max]|nr:hypothetical protein JHK86_000800 [Glycine max]
MGRYHLNLSHSNSLSRAIPLNRENLPFLEVLNVCQNHLIGTIPQSFSSILSLQSIDFSYNNFSGSIPNGHVLQTTPAEAYFGNRPTNCHGAPTGIKGFFYPLLYVTHHCCITLHSLHCTCFFDEIDHLLSFLTYGDLDDDGNPRVDLESSFLDSIKLGDDSPGAPSCAKVGSIVNGKAEGSTASDTQSPSPTLRHALRQPLSAIHSLFPSSRS